MSGRVLAAGLDRTDRNVRNPAQSQRSGRSVRRIVMPWQPLIVLVASITAVAYFAAEPCSGSKLKPRTTLTGHEGSVGSVAFHPDAGPCCLRSESMGRLCSGM